MKKTFIIVALIFILFLLLALLISNKIIFNNQEAPVILTNTSVKPTLQPNSQELKLINITPPEDTTGNKWYSPVTRISFIFDKEVDISSLSLNVQPNIDLESSISASLKTILVWPKALEYWKPNVLYSVIINKGLKAKDGTLLKENIQYQIKATLQGGE
jgi:hypothetical protein